MKYLKLFSLIAFISCFTWACTYNNEEELYGNVAENPCDTVPVTYTQDVLPVLQSRCYSCHNASFASGGVNLEGYNQAKAVAQSGKLLGTISHAPGFSPMPKNGTKLADCDITKISRWIEAGIPEN